MNFILMCKDTPVYDIAAGTLLNEQLAPGCMARGTMDYNEWARTRYCAGTNVSARRLMLRAFGSDNINNAKIPTRALSLSDCYWLKERNEDVKFDDVTPYLHKEWDGIGKFSGGSISTLFVNGSADKQWIDSKTLLKRGSLNEYEAYELCDALNISWACRARPTNDGICLENFTSIDIFLETMQQSGFCDEEANPREKAVEMFGTQAVGLFVLDYLVEHDDRHWGNYGFLRDANTGAYLGMAPYYDFDWAWSGFSVSVPQSALCKHSAFICDLARKAIQIACRFEHAEAITAHANELLNLLSE